MCRDQLQWINGCLLPWFLPIAVVGKQAVRFRLARKGAPGGAFDHFLIDYLEFAAGRNLADTLIEDPSWIEIPPSITQVFHELPWFHYQSTVVEAGQFGNGLPAKWSRTCGWLAVKTLENTNGWTAMAVF